MITAMRKVLPLLIILVIYVLLGWLFAAQVPDWQAPDEPAHYNYVRQLADGRLPIITPGDYDQAYLEEIVGAGFPPDYPIETIEYEDWQPPLYYLLLLPVYELTDGSLLALRLVSVLIGAGVIILAYAIARLLFPDRMWVAWTTAVFVAFLPQHLAMMASVNNDSLSELLIAAILLVLLRWAELDLGQPQSRNVRYLVGLGVLLGLGFLTKGTVYLMPPVLGLALLWKRWRQWSRLFREAVLLFAPAFLLGAVWWIRNLIIYGGIDVLGKAAHDAVVVGQPRTIDWIAQYGLEETLRRFAQTTFNSFWGQFGWMGVLMDPRVYLVLLLLTGTAVAGLLLHRIAEKNRVIRSVSNLQQGVLITTFLLTLGLHVGYNLTFVQHQGRYLFPALIPISLALTIGLGSWLLLLQRPFADRRPHLVLILPIGLGTALIGLNLLALFQFILPQLT